MFILALFGWSHPVTVKIIGMEFCENVHFNLPLLQLLLPVYHLLHLCLVAITVFSALSFKSKWKATVTAVMVAAVAMKHSFKLSTKLRWNDCHSNLFWPNYEDCKNCFLFHLAHEGERERFIPELFFLLNSSCSRIYFLALSMISTHNSNKVA